ncbi:MAG: cbb3-type cytochrome oxidase assembly protein CcoS [Proteobacteria bacterium]|nr:MAG: cbb3-type cytochrome oxidase assembly protein CcoS [Pseudomonadota bacterium]
MIDYFYLIPVAIGLGVIGLGAFMWSLRSGQYEDLDGAAERILVDEDRPIQDPRPQPKPDLTPHRAAHR